MNGPGRTATDPRGPRLPGLECHFVRTRLRVDLPSRGEEAHLELFDGHTCCADRAVPSVEALEKAFGIAREPLNLLRFSCATHCEHCRPQGAVNQRVLAVE
jgi:hypothetical protein